jgi:hypothetical protein
MTLRLYERKKDAEFVAARANKLAKGSAKIRRVRVTSEKAARDAGVEVRHDLSIASHSPKQGAVGWIVVRGGLKQVRKECGSALEFLQK